jgi:hypothetical protein
MHNLVSYGLFGIKDDSRHCQKGACWPCGTLYEGSYGVSAYWRAIEGMWQTEAEDHDAPFDSDLAARHAHP